MSVNCIGCVVRDRTGIDLLCDDCRELRKLRLFKQMTHSYLDRLGVPNDPEPEETVKTSCRMGTRFKYLAKVIAAADEMAAQCDNYAVAICGGMPDVKLVAARHLDASNTDYQKLRRVKADDRKYGYEKANPHSWEGM